MVLECALRSSVSDHILVQWSETCSMCIPITGDINNNPCIGVSKRGCANSGHSQLNIMLFIYYMQYHCFLRGRSRLTAIVLECALQGHPWMITIIAMVLECTLHGHRSLIIVYRSGFRMGSVVLRCRSHIAAMDCVLRGYTTFLISHFTTNDGSD